MTDNEMELRRAGNNFLGLLNDLKRRPEDASKELEIPLEQINEIIAGKKEITPEIVTKATKVWPVNNRDFYLLNDDCPNGVKIMRREDSEKSSRIMNRAGKPYYEYRDTVMSSVAPFRPEWIKELCIVGDNEPNNPDIQWNNGHFMHQFTYFIGDVNFYYVGINGEKKVAVMNTGDSNYITPFTPHSFATRKGAQTNGLILALTYGNNLMGDPQQELSALGIEFGSEFAMNFSKKECAIAELIKFHRENLTISIKELSERTGIEIQRIELFEAAKITPTFSEYNSIAKALKINVRDLFPNDVIENKVIVQIHQKSKHWYYPQQSKTYEMVELASSTNLPFSKALELNVLSDIDDELDLKVGLHQYGYNVSDKELRLNWKANKQKFSETIKPGDSFYIKPFVPHNFRGKSKILILRVGGKITGEPQRELSLIGKENTKRAINETMQWYDPEGRN